MNEGRIAWHARQSNVEEILALIDLLEQAREVMKKEPDAGLTIEARPETMEIVFTIASRDSDLQAVINPDIPDIQLHRSIKLLCQKTAVN